LKNKSVSVGIIGFGTVGTGTAKILLKKQKDFERKLGFPVVLKTIADLDIKTDRGMKLGKVTLTDNVDVILDDPDIDIVVELIGGTGAAEKLTLAALKKGKHVVTANKALLAEKGDGIFKTAAENNVSVGFEASVAGSIPIIKIVRESLIGNRIDNIYGIINGTANYILSKMTDEGAEFSDVLKEAQDLGYAEADPTFDIEGVDSAHKITLLASLAFGLPLSFKKVYTEGITGITPLDIEFASEFGYKIKLLAITKQDGNDIEIRVHPSMIPDSNLISSVNGVFNAIHVDADATGAGLYYGKGAGELPTGSAVVSDIIDIARNIKSGAAERFQDIGILENKKLKVRKMEDIRTSYYLRFSVKDKPGVLSAIAGILGKHNISIESMIQKGRETKKAVTVVMMTHEAKEKDMVTALKEINRLSDISGKTMFLRVEGGEA